MSDLGDSKTYAVKIFILQKVTPPAQPPISDFPIHKEDKNIIEPTGLLLIYVENFDFYFGHLDKKKIFAHYRSLCGRHHYILVHADGLLINLSNFKETYNRVGSS